MADQHGFACQHCEASFLKKEDFSAHLQQTHPGQPFHHSVQDDKHKIEYYHYATPAHPHWFILSDKQSGKYLSNLNLGHDGEVLALETHPKYRRQGLATKLWNYAKLRSDIGIPTPKHSTARTRQGEAWAKKVGGELPKRGNLLSARQMRGMIDFDTQ